jgi:hypothetical protein
MLLYCRTVGGDAILDVDKIVGLSSTREVLQSRQHYQFVEQVVHGTAKDFM